VLSAVLLKSQDWNVHTPSLQSQVARLGRVKAESLLSLVCVSIVDTKDAGLTCKTRSLGPKFADISDHQFRPTGVILGHFLDAAGEDAVISGWSAETHPYHWGGTLLLTRDNGKWKPVWYKSGLITRSCEKAEQPDGRELLICEFEDAGMGDRYHTLFGVDLQRPSTAMALTQADTFESNTCWGQRQVMQPLTWDVDHRKFSVVVQTPEWQRLDDGACGPHPPKRPPRSASLEFKITDDGLKPTADAPGPIKD